MPLFELSSEKLELRAQKMTRKLGYSRYRKCILDVAFCFSFTVDDNANSFLVQLSTWDMEELKEKLEERAQCSQQTIENMNNSLKAFLSRTNRLQALSSSDGESSVM